MNAKEIVNKLIESDPDDPGQNIERHSQGIYHERRFGGKLLAAQPESADPVYHTSFDMWNDEADPEAEPWEWNDPRAIDQFNREIEGICKEVPSVDCARLRELAGYYLVSGNDHTWEMIADELVNKGYSVWYSDTYFEVYRPEDIAEQENVDRRDEDEQ